MAKKNSKKFFNLFEAEADTVSQSEVSAPIQEAGGQLTMFEMVDNESIENTEDIFEITPVVKEEPAPEAVEPEEESEAVEADFEVTPVVSEASAEEEEETFEEEEEEEEEEETFEEEASEEIPEMTETEKFFEDDSYIPPEELEILVSAEDESDEFEIPQSITPPEPVDFKKSLPRYEDIKNTPVLDSFETAYVFTGKSGEHIRYRLSLPSKRSAKQNRNRKNIMSWIITFVAAILLAVFLRTFVFVLAKVDGPSMLPTLHHQESLIVTKYSYVFGEIERGDIVICRYDTPEYPDTYVKRVIGLPGETIRIENGIVYIDGAAIKEDYTLEPARYDMESYTIPEGKVFVLGDNRNNSADSRRVGPLDKSQILGKVRFRIYPFTSIGSLEDK